METDHDNINQALETLPNGFARHQVVLDDQNNPADYIFLEVNAAFEEMTGLKRENILGRKVTEVLPGIEKDDFDWIGVYGKVATEGNSLNFEQYSEPLQRWYEVQIYSDEPGFFTTVFNEITARKEELASMKGLLELTEELFNTDLATFDYQSAAGNLLKLSGAKFAAINTYEDDRTKTVIRAISGIPSMIESASKLLGFKIAGQAWEIIPERLRKIEGGKLVRFNSLYETAMGALNKTTSTALHKLTGIGDIYVLELAYGGRETTGDIIFFMPKGKGIHNREVIELYAGQLGAVLGRLRAEEKLLKNEKRLSMAQVNARAGYWEYDLKKERLYWSKECEALFGLEEGEFEGTFDAFLKRIHPEDKEYVLAMNQPITESKKGIPLEYEHRIIKKDGTVIWIRETADTVYDKTSEAAFITGFVMDITERKKAEIMLQESEAHLNQFFSQSLTGFFFMMLDEPVTWDETTDKEKALDYIFHHQRMTKVNQAMLNQYGATEEDFIGKIPYELFKHDLEHGRHIWRGLFEQGRWQVETNERRMDGTPIIIDGDYICLYDGEGRITGHFGVQVDITEQKEKEKQLRESEARLDALISQTPAVIYSYKLTGEMPQITYVNQNVKTLLGFEPEEFIDNFELFKECIHPKDAERLFNSIPKLIEEGRITQDEYRFKDKQGNYHWLHDEQQLITQDDGSMEVIGAWWDVTERKKVEEDLFMQKERLSNIVEGANVATWEWNVQTGEHIVNERWAEMIGYKLEEIHAGSIESWHKYTHPLDLEMSNNEMEKLFKGEVNFYNVENRRKHKNGQWIWVNDRGKVISWTDDGKPLWVFGTLTDITGRKEAEEALSERLAFEKMVSQISTIFINQPPEELDRGLNEALKAAGQFFGADRSYLYAFSEDGKTYSVTHTWCAPGIASNYEKDQNRQVRLQSCWAGELLEGNTVIINDVESMPPGQEEDKKDFLSEEIKSLLSIPLAGGGKVFGCFGLNHVNQKHTWAEDQVNLLQVVAELFAGALARHKNEKTIRRLSFHDQLTGLYNRRYFENELERLDSSREHPVTVISADLDGLKLINDTLGHSEGDRYLQAGADLLKNTLRESDILARVGGDEFALLLPRTGKVEAELLTNRMRRQIDNYNLEQKNLPLSISLGLAVSENPDYSLEEVFRMADNNMYTEKLEQGKKARTEIVSSLLASLFKRDNLAEGERAQVQELAIRLGLALKLEESRMADLELLAQVYDLGKVSLPDNLLHQSILENTEELTEAEREAIHRHPETGYRIALASPDLAGVAELILRHHENYDGSGYPLGLKGEKVPIECRILAIAIAYSAMTHPRPYAETLSHAEALAELKRCSGSQFDPQLVEIFNELIEKNLKS